MGAVGTMIPVMLAVTVVNSLKGVQVKIVSCK